MTCFSIATTMTLLPQGLVSFTKYNVGWMYHPVSHGLIILSRHEGKFMVGNLLNIINKSRCVSCILSGRPAFRTAIPALY